MKQNWIRFITVIVALFYSFSAYPLEDKLQSQAEALRVIAEFADSFCKITPINGHSKNVELSGEAKAKLNNTLSKLVELGIEGAAKYKDESFSNVLQKDLAKSLEDNLQCRRDVWNSLKDKMITSSSEVNKKYSVIFELGMPEGFDRPEISFNASDFDVYVDSKFRGTIGINDNILDLGFIDVGSHTFSLNNATELQFVKRDFNVQEDGRVIIDTQFKKRNIKDQTDSNGDGLAIKRDCGGTFEVDSSKTFKIAFKLDVNNNFTADECTIIAKNDYQDTKMNNIMALDGNIENKEISSKCISSLNLYKICRVKFNKGQSSGILKSNLQPNDNHSYLLWAKAGQTIKVLYSSKNNLRLSIYKLMDSNVLATNNTNSGEISAEIPISDDYLIVVNSFTDEIDYELNISII